MKSPLLGLLLFCACTTGPPAREANNGWDDPALWPVLEAQDHRDTPALCRLLSAEQSTVRAAAAMAFASVQDSTALPCLLKGMLDPEPLVRRNSAYALGFVADSAAMAAMAEAVRNEADTLVQRALFTATFRTAHRLGQLKEPNAVLYYLERNRGQERARAADVLRRLPAPTLQAIRTEYLGLVARENDADVRGLLVGGLGKLEGDDIRALLQGLAGGDHPLPVRVNAIRVLGSIANGQDHGTQITLLTDGHVQVRTAAMEALERAPATLDPDQLLAIGPAMDGADAQLRYRYLGLLVQVEPTRARAMSALSGPVTLGPHAEAARIRAWAMGDPKDAEKHLNDLLFSEAHPAVRQAAFEALATRSDRRMTMPRAIPSTVQVREAAPFWHAVFRCKDPGIIAAAAEHLRGNTPETLEVLFPVAVEQEAMRVLGPVRDLETRQLLVELAHARDGLPPPVHAAPPFGHPIDPERARTMPQGQHYLVATNRGDLWIRTDVNGAPGTVLAFDSLVRAGYYNGRSWHRMVPNFVVQGGCPRGDGYGSMPWTLRTEVGEAVFGTGAVGMASAGRDTESCQFFVTHSPTPHLDGRYTCFGRVVEGMDVVLALQVGDTIRAISPVSGPTDRGRSAP